MVIRPFANCTEESAAHFTHDLHHDNSFGWCNSTPPSPPSVSAPPPPPSLVFTHTSGEAGERSVFHFSTVWFIGGCGAYRWGAADRCVSPHFPSKTKKKKNREKKMCNYWSCAANQQPASVCGINPPVKMVVMGAKWRLWHKFGRTPNPNQ